MRETPMEQSINLDALQEQYNDAPLWDSSMDPVYRACPALIAQVRELRAYGKHIEASFAAEAR